MGRAQERQDKRGKPFWSDYRGLGDVCQQPTPHYGRFDVRDPTPGCEHIYNQLGSHEPIKLTELNVARCLSKLRLNTAPGPDGLKARVLKACTHQLSGVITELFQTLLDLCVFPSTWKKSTIVPLPKVKNATALNDFRPITLTPLLAKCMERVVSSHLMSMIEDQLDPLQFAYRPHRGTEDATIMLVDSIAKHLQQGWATGGPLCTALGSL